MRCQWCDASLKGRSYLKLTYYEPEKDSEGKDRWVSVLHKWYCDEKCMVGEK